MVDKSSVIGAHLVGSAPVESAEQIFTLASTHLGKHLGRIGDGEIGERDTWILFQKDRLNQSPQLESSTPSIKRRFMMWLAFARGVKISPPVQLKEGISDPDQIELPPLGYAKAALESYQKFREMKSAGTIPAHIRFMVGLPATLGVVTAMVVEASRSIVLPAYHKKMMAELEQILNAIPHDQLSIQWETVFEIMILEKHKMWRYHGENAEEHIRSHLIELLDSVPEDVECGFHFCYGDAGHKHFIEPSNTGLVTKMANWISANSKRSLDFLHLPVPRDRDDSSYFEALNNLSIPDSCQLFLGLVHETGGEEGTQRRIDTAKKTINRAFGVATECGLARRSQESLAPLLIQHRQVASPISN